MASCVARHEQPFSPEFNVSYSATKKIMTMRFAVSAALVFAAPPATADYPEKPVRFIVGFTPGGPSDIVARLLGQKLAELWKEQVIIDNRAGAGGNIAAEITAKSPGDGYTLLLGNNSILATNAALYNKLPY